MDDDASAQVNRTAGRIPWYVAVLACVVLGGAVGLGKGLPMLAGVACLVVVVAASASPALASIVALGLITVLGGLTIVDFGSLPDLTVERVVVVWILVVLSAHSRARGRRTKGGTLMGRTVASALAALVVVVFFAALRAPSVTSALQIWVDQYLVPALLLARAATFPWDRTEAERVLKGVVFLGLVWVVLGLAEFTSGMSLFTIGGLLPWAGAGAALTRGGASFINPAAQGTAIGLAGCALLFLARVQGGSARPALAIGAVLLLGVCLTLTRASLLAVAVVLVLFALAEGRLGTAAIVWVGVLASVASALLPGAVDMVALQQRFLGESPIFNRIVIYSASLRLMLLNPLGLGLGRFAGTVAGQLQGVGSIDAMYGSGVLVPHNTVLYVAVEAGWAGAIALLTLWGGLIHRGFEGLGRRPESLLILSLVAVYVVNAMAIDMSLVRAVTALFAFLSGLSLAMLARTRRFAEAGAPE